MISPTTGSHNLILHLKKGHMPQIKLTKEILYKVDVLNKLLL